MLITPLFASISQEKISYTIGKASFNMIQLPGMRDFEIASEAEEYFCYGVKEEGRNIRQIVPIALGETPVTQGLWDEVRDHAKKKNISSADILSIDPSCFKGNSRPVNMVWYEVALEFCSVLNLILNKPEGFFRVPTEAEWEYACKGKQRGRFYSGSDNLDEVGWYDKNNKLETLPAGMLAPNSFGFYDMSGNVREWCTEDRQLRMKYRAPLYAERESIVKDETLNPYQRGGAFWDWEYTSRSGYLQDEHPDFRNRDSGFRLAAPAHLRPDERI